MKVFFAVGHGIGIRTYWVHSIQIENPILCWMRFNTFVLPLLSYLYQCLLVAIYASLLTHIIFQTVLYNNLLRFQMLLWKSNCWWCQVLCSCKLLVCSGVGASSRRGCVRSARWHGTAPHSLLPAARAGGLPPRQQQRLNMVAGRWC